MTTKLSSRLAAEPVPLEGGPERDFDVRYYLDLLWRRRILLAATAIGGLALGILGAELQAPRYQARSLLQVMPPNPTSLAVTDALVSTGNPIRDRQFFNTQLNVLRSRSIAERVVERLKLADRHDFKEGGDPTAIRRTRPCGPTRSRTSTWTTAWRARSRPRRGPTSG